MRLRPPPSIKWTSRSMLELDDVTKTFTSGAHKTVAVAGVSLRLVPNTLTAIMGPSGCGKSTLLTIAGGLQPPDQGSVSIGSTVLSDLPEPELYALRRKRVGFVFQSYNLVRMLSAMENVALSFELDGVARRVARGHAGDALAAVGMADLASRLPSTLSGGQQQRVALARAFAGGDKLILADEPTGALDSTNAETVLHVLEDLVARGSTALIATHDPNVAGRADRILMMHDGVLVSDNAPAA